MNIVDKISKIGDNISITLVDNGFVFEVSGRDAADNWKTLKVVCTSRSELDSLIDEALELDRAD